MRNSLRINSLIIAIFAFSFMSFAGKTVKIKLTGSSYEDILMTMGQSGRTEVISSLPFVFEIPKDQLPVKLKFQSENYLYYDIDIPKKPVDTTGHVYLVKVNETAMALRNNVSNNVGNTMNIMGQSTLTVPIEGIDTNYGVNAAPTTGAKNEKTFAIIIANEKYEMATDVENAANDGLAFKEYCIKTLGIPGNNVKYSSNLSFGKMKKAVNDALELAGSLNGDATLLFYYAGHGIPDNQTKDAFIMPVDADGTDTEVCLSLNDLYKKINSKNLKHCVVFLDACFSGAQRDGEMIVAARGVKLKPKESIPQGRTIVFSATSGEQAAFSHKQEKHGLFTYYLLSKLQETKGNVKLGDLADYLSEKVSFESRRINNMPQTPTVTVSNGMEDKWKSIKLR